MPTVRVRRRLTATTVAVALIGAPAYALAATKNGLTPSSPKANATVPVAEGVTFKGKAKGSGSVFVHVCKSAKKSKKDGLICNDEVIAKARKTGGRFTYTQKVFGFPAYWLNRAGTYYWQAHRIACESGNTDDCRLEGPVVKFKVG